jgi:hypothetical protein
VRVDTSGRAWLKGPAGSGLVGAFPEPLHGRRRRANSERGRWVAAIRAVCSTLRSAAKTSWNFVESIANSTAVS